MSETIRKPIAEQIFGDNRPPIDEVLRVEYDAEREKVDLMLEAMNDAPEKVSSEDDVTAIGRLIVGARETMREIEDLRSREGKPLFDAKKALDAFFKDLTAKIERKQAELQTRADEYVRRKQAEERESARRRAEEARKREEDARQRAENAKSADAAGRQAAAAEQAAAQADAETKAAAEGTKIEGASVRKVWSFTITDYDAIDLNVLAPFMSEECVTGAIRKMVNAQKGRAKIPGVHVFEETKTTFRK